MVFKRIFSQNLGDVSLYFALFFCRASLCPGIASLRVVYDLAAAALAVVLRGSQEAALQEQMLRAERAAMTAEDRSRYLAQRFFTGSTQVPSTIAP